MSEEMEHVLIEVTSTELREQIDRYIVELQEAHERARAQEQMGMASVTFGGSKHLAGAIERLEFLRDHLVDGTYRVSPLEVDQLIVGNPMGVRLYA